MGMIEKNLSVTKPLAEKLENEAERTGCSQAEITRTALRRELL